jgi:hypothetical protein
MRSSRAGLSAASRGQSSWGTAMTIHSLFKDAPFEPEEIAILVAAFEETLRTLGLKDRGDPLTEMIARKIISIAQTGIRDPDAIAKRAIKELGFSG